MAEFKNVARAFLPGVAAAEKRLKDIEGQVEEEDADRIHHRKVQGFERRTDEALSEGRALAAEFNLQQMKRAIGAAQTGQALTGLVAARAIEGPSGTVPMITQADSTALEDTAHSLALGGGVAQSVSDQDIEELAMRFARQVEDVSDPIERQRHYRSWTQDLRKGMPEFQAVEVEKRAREIINSYR